MTRYTPDEDATLKRLYKTAAKARLLQALPGRTWGSIKQRGQVLRLLRPRIYEITEFWMAAKNRDALQALWPSAPRAELFAAFPGQTWCALRQRAHRFGLKRSQVATHTCRKPSADPVIAELVRLRLNLGLSHAQMAAKFPVRAKTFAAWERGVYNVTYGHLKKWCRFLGMQMGVVPAVSRMKQQAAIDMAAWKRKQDALERGTGPVVKYDNRKAG